MKRYIYILCGLSILFGCSLKEEVLSNSTRDTYYKNEIQVRTGLVGCYTQARNIYANVGFWQMTECTTDLISLSNSTQYDANCDVSPSRPGVASTVWSNGYTGVMRCNELIDVLNESTDFTEEQKLPWIAEAMIMRAFYYYVLTSTFGDVPFYTEAVTEENRANIARLPRMSAKATRDSLANELIEFLMPESYYNERIGRGGRQILPLERTYQNPVKAYAGAAVGLMIAGKMCMWNERYEDAIDVFSQLEEIYGNYRGGMRPLEFGVDYPLSDVRWREKNVKESILELGNHVEEFGLAIKGGLASYCMPTRTIASLVDADESTSDVSDIYNGIVIPELGAYAKTNSSALPTSYFYTKLLRYSSTDLRNGEYSNGEDTPRNGCGNLAWRWAGTGYVKSGIVEPGEGVYWFNKPSSSNPSASKDKPYGNNQPWLGDKFWCFGMYNSQDSNNYKIFRYAGVLLNLAEAYLVGRNNMSTACEYLNVIRTRARIDALTPDSVKNSPEALMEEIRMECARELFGEFQRKFDLVRWGIWYERAYKYNEGKYIKEYILPCHEYWPIPAEQITYSENALDNNSYKE